MNPAGVLLASVVENDVTAHRICKELQAHDFETLDGCPVDFDWKGDLVSSDVCVEDADVLRCSLRTRARMQDEAGICVDGVTLKPVTGGVPILLRE